MTVSDETVTIPASEYAGLLTRVDGLRARLRTVAAAHRDVIKNWIPKTMIEGPGRNILLDANRMRRQLDAAREVVAAARAVSLNRQVNRARTPFYDEVSVHFLEPLRAALERFDRATEGET